MIRGFVSVKLLESLKINGYRRLIVVNKIKNRINSNKSFIKQILKGVLYKFLPSPIGFFYSVSRRRNKENNNEWYDKM